MFRFFLGFFDFFSFLLFFYFKFKLIPVNYYIFPICAWCVRYWSALVLPWIIFLNVLQVTHVAAVVTKPTTTTTRKGGRREDSYQLNFLALSARELNICTHTKIRWLQVLRWLQRGQIKEKEWNIKKQYNQIRAFIHISHIFLSSFKGKVKKIKRTGKKINATRIQHK